MSGQPVPSQLDQVLPRFYVQKAGPYHPFGRIRIAPFGKGGLRILAESGYTKTLDSRISAALSANGEASRDTLTALIAEANNSIRIANTVIETETPSLLDLDNDDPDRSRELIASNKLKIERLTLAIPQLQSRIGWLSFCNEEGRPEGPHDTYSPNNERPCATYRRSHDAASVSAFRSNLLPRTTSRRFRDRARNPWARLEQDHTNLCRLVEPASQSGIQPISAQAARGSQVAASKKEAARVKAHANAKASSCQRVA